MVQGKHDKLIHEDFHVASVQLFVTDTTYNEHLWFCYDPLLCQFYAMLAEVCLNILI
jgi:hypothetical protein